MKKKIFKKIFAVALMIATVLSFTVQVLAKDYENLASGESIIISIEKSCNPGASWYTDTESSPTYSYPFLGGSASVHMGFVTSDGYSLGSPRHGSDGNILWVYCMEYNVDGYTGVSPRVGATVSATTDSLWKGLSAEQQNGIKLALLLGYPMSNNGGSAADSFAATQALIWEFQTGIRNSTSVNARYNVNYTYRTSGGGTATTYLPSNTFYNMMSVGSGGITAYNTLVSKIYSYSKLPDFGTGSLRIELPYNTSSGKYEKTLTDKNGVLSNYDVSVPAGSGVTVSVKGNNLTLSASKYINGVTLTLTKKAVSRTSQDMLILTPQGFGQTMVMGQPSFTAASTVYKVYALNGSLKIQKQSSDGVISGIKFNVKGPGINTVLITNASGVAYLNNVPIGTYTITEQTPDKYVKIDAKNVIVQSGLTSVANFSNVVKSGDFVALKLDAETGKAVPGAQFELYDENDNHLATEITDENGKATFKNLLYGNYYAIESIAPEGYLLNENVFHFSIKENGEVITEEFRNDIKYRKIGVYKKGEVFSGFEKSIVDEREVYTPIYEIGYLSGCEVEVYAKEDIYTKDGTLRYEKDELVDTIVTDSLGPVYTKDLYEGQYYLHEKKAPDGYVLSSGDKEVDLFSDGIEITFEDLRQTCSLYFKKSMSNTTIDAMSGYFRYVAFGIFSAEDMLDLKKDSLLEIIKPNEVGDCVMSVDLPCGYKYYVKELSTAEGFILDENKYEFSFLPVDCHKADVPITIGSDNVIVNEMVPKVIDREIHVDSESTSGSVDRPKTMDENTFLLYTVLSLFSGLFILIIILKNKKLTYYQ